jgi:hypothetical protein
VYQQTYIYNMQKYRTPFNRHPLVELPAAPRILQFSSGNAKVAGTATAVFGLPAGYTCPGAKDCLAWYDREEKRLIDGADAKFRCFAASMEAYLPNRRGVLDRNLTALKEAGSSDAMAELLENSMPAAFYRFLRVHDDGDFFHQDYFLAWVKVARNNRRRTFYGYTKSLPIWVRHKKEVPDNFVLTASRGGKWDSLIEANGLRSAVVVFHPDEAEAAGLEIDHDDSLAKARDGRDFALLLHGQQKPGSAASDAIKRMNKEGVKYSYNRRKASAKNKKSHQNK